MVEPLSEDIQPRDPGVVYVLENEAFAVPVVKIGKTAQRDWVDRIKQLNTAVPLPFICAKASRVDDMRRVETFLHQTFHPAKRQWRGEFYEVDAWRVAQVLELFQVEDVTNLAPAPDIADERAIDESVKVRERKDNFNFEMLDIPVGAELAFVQDDTITCKVIQQKPPRVELDGEPTWLSAAAKKVKQSKWGLQGARYWMYEDETLKERRDRMEREAEEDTE